MPITVYVLYEMFSPNPAKMSAKPKIVAIYSTKERAEKAMEEYQTWCHDVEMWIESIPFDEGPSGLAFSLVHMKF